MQTRKNCIQMLIAESENFKTVTHSVKGQTVWIIREVDNFRLIECATLSTGADGWEFNLVSEVDGPTVYNCPLKYLDMVLPGRNLAWRKQVREYHEAKQLIRNKLERANVGDKLILQGVSAPYVFIRSLKPLRGSYGKSLYKVSIRHIRDIEFVEGNVKRFDK